MSSLDQNLFLKTPPDNVICVVCRNVVEYPLRAPCKHMFCTVCIERWLMRKESCPICRKTVRQTNLRPPTAQIKRLIDALELWCGNKEAGCRRKWTVQSYLKHTNKCGYEAVACENEGCTTKVLRRRLNEHKTSECRFERVVCTKGCGLDVFKHGFDQHNCVSELGTIVKDQKEQIDRLFKAVTVLYKASRSRPRSHFDVGGGAGSTDSDDRIYTTLRDLLPARHAETLRPINANTSDRTLTWQQLLNVGDTSSDHEWYSSEYSLVSDSSDTEQQGGDVGSIRVQLQHGNRGSFIFVSSDEEGEGSRRAPGSNDASSRGRRRRATRHRAERLDAESTDGANESDVTAGNNSDTSPHASLPAVEAADASTDGFESTLSTNAARNSNASPASSANDAPPPRGRKRRRVDSPRPAEGDPEQPGTSRGSGDAPAAADSRRRVRRTRRGDTASSPPRRRVATSRTRQRSSRRERSGGLMFSRLNGVTVRMSAGDLLARFAVDESSDPSFDDLSSFSSTSTDSLDSSDSETD